MSNSTEKPVRVFALWRHVPGGGEGRHLMTGTNIREALEKIEAESSLRFSNGWEADLDALERGDRTYLDAQGKRTVDAAIAEARAGL